MAHDIIAVVNQKGGVGKTTTAVNIAAALAEFGLSTLLVDLDPQANATTGVGLTIDENRPAGIYRAIADEIDITRCFQSTAVDGLRVIPSCMDLAGLEVELVADTTRRTVAELLKPLHAAYDFIIIDTPPSLGVLTLNSLVAAHSLLIPIQCEYYALEGLRQLLRTINLVRQALNPSLRILGLLRTMHDARTNLSQDVAAEVERFFLGRVLETIVPRNVRLSEAPSYGQPVLVYAPESSGARAYRQAAREVASLFPEIELPPPPDDEPQARPADSTDEDQARDEAETDRPSRRRFFENDIEEVLL